MINTVKPIYMWKFIPDLVTISKKRIIWNCVSVGVGRGKDRHFFYQMQQRAAFWGAQELLWSLLIWSRGLDSYSLPLTLTLSLLSPSPLSLSHTSACLLPSPPLPFTHTLTHKCRVCFPPALPPSPPDRASLLKVELKGTSHHWSSLRLPKHPL